MSYIKTTNTGWTIRREGTTVTTVGDTSFPTGDFKGALGSESSTEGSYALSGDIAEVLVYDRDVIADGTWQQVYDYLRHCYYPPPPAALSSGYTRIVVYWSGESVGFGRGDALYDG